MQNAIKSLLTRPPILPFPNHQIDRRWTVQHSLIAMLSWWTIVIWGVVPCRKAAGTAWWWWCWWCCSGSLFPLFSISRPPTLRPFAVDCCCAVFLDGDASKPPPEPRQCRWSQCNTTVTRPLLSIIFHEGVSFCSSNAWIVSQTIFGIAAIAATPSRAHRYCAVDRKYALTAPLPPVIGPGQAVGRANRLWNCEFPVERQNEENDLKSMREQRRT